MLLMICLLLISSLLALLSGFILFTAKFGRPSVIRGVTAIGAGALLGAAFFDLLPEALEHLKEPAYQWLGVGLAGGFVLFFVLERTFSGFHSHHEHQKIDRKLPQRSLLIIGNASHRAMDGIAIGAAFAASPKLGTLLVIATAAHEVPRTVGDFGLLLGRGMGKYGVIIVHALSSLFAIMLAALVYHFGGSNFDGAMPYILAAIAGSFIYIAAADIIPEIHERPHREANRQSLLLLAGIAIIPLVAYLLRGISG